MNIPHLAAAIAVGTIGAAFGSISAALVQIWTHRRDSRAKHEAERIKFVCTPHSMYAESWLWAALAAAMAFTLGIVLVVGGPARTSANAYYGIVQYGGPDLLGAAFVACAILTWLCAWRRRRLLDWALLLQAIPFAMTAVLFAIAAFRYDDANLTATPVYSWIMIMHACLADYARRQY